MKNKPKLIIFDVNETLLNLDPLKVSINQALGEDHAAEIWFSELLHYSLVESISGSYHNFSEIAAAVFKMNASKYGKEYSNKQINSILETVSKLAPYPDVIPGLSKLKDSGFKLMAFSNGKSETLKDQLTYAKIDHFFHHILSVEIARKFKPHPYSYSSALEFAHINAKDAMMVAAHGWDVAGASRVGLQTTFIEKAGKFLYPLAEKPDFVVENILELSDRLSVK